MPTEECWQQAIIPFYPFDSNKYIAYLPSTNMQNENLKWETTEQYNVGLDLGFLERPH